MKLAYITLIPDMNAASWTALLTAIGVITAITLQILEWRRVRFSRQIEIITNLDARFETVEFRSFRRRAAKYLISPSIDDVEGKEAVQAILGFFETLGYLYKREVVDAESAWHFFASWLLPYYAASQQFRVEFTEGDPNIYADAEKIYRVVKDKEILHHPSKDTLHVLGPEAIREFLTDEAGLLIKAVPAKS